MVRLDHTLAVAKFASHAARRVQRRSIWLSSWLPNQQFAQTAEVALRRWRLVESASDNVKCFREAKAWRVREAGFIRRKGVCEQRRRPHNARFAAEWRLFGHAFITGPGRVKLRGSQRFGAEERT